jgi:TP901 family phage tail tape measure protein
MAEITQKMGFDATSAIKNLAKLTDKLNEANQAMANMQSAKGGAATLDKVTDSTKKAKKGAESFLISWQTLARILGTQILIRGLNTTIQGLKDAVEQARLLGLAVEEVRTIDSAGRGALNLTQDILALSDAIGKAPVDLAEGLYQTLSNQVVEAGEALEFTARAAKLATVTASETGDAVNALSSVMNSYQLSAGQAEHVAGTLFKTVELGRLRLNEIANVIGRVTPLTATLGIKWEEAAASLAVMTRQGVRADTAITQLRAVVTRLIKPTDEMREIFHKWGVTDGKQAIATFGGLGGVLKKLSEETGSSSEGMAELLRNVRAISGQLGIMTDDGALLAEVMGEIEQGSKAATEAWNEFAESDAQRLTQEMQQFSNALTRLGTASMPAVIKSLEVLTAVIDRQVAGVEGIKELAGYYSEADKAADSYARAVKRGEENARKIREASANAGKKTFEALSSASNLYYAEANKKEFALRAVRDNGIKQATAALNDATQGLSNFYKGSIKQLENFVKDSGNRIKDIQSAIGDTEKDINDEVLEYKLKNEKDTYRKVGIVKDNLRKAEAEADKKFAEIGTRPGALKEFEEAQKAAIEYRKLIEKISIEGEHGFIKTRDAHEDVVKSYERLNEGREKGLQYEKETNALVEKQIALREQALARLEELDKQEKAITKDAVVTDAEEQQLKDIRREREAINEQIARGAEALKGRGIEQDFRTVTAGLTIAMNEAHKDWAAEVARLKAEFNRNVFPIRLALDPEGIRGALGEQLGVERIEGQSEAAYFQRVNDAALAAQKEIQANGNALAAIEQELVEKRTAYSEALARSAELQITEAAELEKSKNRVLNITTSAKQRNQIEENYLALQNRQAIASETLNQKYREAGQLLRQGGALTTQQINELTRTALVAAQNKDISAEELDIFREMSKQLEDMSARRAEAADIKDAIPSRADQQLMEQVILAETRRKEEKLEAKQIENGITDAQRKYRDSLIESQSTAGGLKTTTEGIKEDTTGTAEAQKNIGGYATTATGAINAEAAATTHLANETERVARAKAAMAQTGAGPGAALVQNPFNAVGGVIGRGSDTVSASLTPGEMVVNKSSSRQFFSELNAMNQGSRPVYREQGGSVTQVGDVNVTVNGGGSSQQTVREIGHGLRREIQRGNIKLR